MRLATFNVLHGRSLSDGQVSEERLVAACASLDADVLCLQEIDRGQPRSGGIDQTAAVARGMGAADWRFEPAIVGEPGGIWRAASDEDSAGTVDAANAAAGLRGPNAAAEAGLRGPNAAAAAAGAGDGEATGGGQEPSYGIGLVSRLPVRRWHVVRLRAARVRAPVFVAQGRGGLILLPDEPRVALAAEVNGPDGPLLVATTHLSFVMGYNAFQLRRVTTALAALKLPVVLLGDLNMPGPFPRWATGWRPLAERKTFPVPVPRLQIDHALATGAVPPVVAVETRQLPLSDHLALLIDFASSTGGRTGGPNA